MPDSIPTMYWLDDALPAERLTRLSVRRFVFVMRALAENDLWDDAQRHLADAGCPDITVSSEAIGLVQALLRDKVAAGVPITTRGRRFMNSLSCFGGHPTPPPVYPHQGGGDGGVKAQ